jgi:hypothetical protein
MARARSLNGALRVDAGDNQRDCRGHHSRPPRVSRRFLVTQLRISSVRLEVEYRRVVFCGQHEAREWWRLERKQQLAFAIRLF